MPNNLDINKTIGDVSKLNEELKETAKIIGGIINQQSKLSTEISKSKGQTDLNKKVNQVKTQQNEIEKQGNKLLAQRNTLIAKQSKALQPLTKEVVKQQEAIKEQNKQLKEQARQELGLKKRTGLFKSMTKSILASASAMFGLVAIFRTLRDAGKLVREFQKENAVLAGVLNKTRKEVSALTKDAQRLGATTAKTAKEVTALQIAYARLGFTQEEILNLTEDTINGSIALQAELDETAELTGAMVRSFKELDTTDADLILDQLTLSTQKTALNFQKLQTALPIVAGAASAAGVQFKTVVAQLGQAADRGIDASTAATSLRNVYIQLADKGLTLEQALKKINTSQDKLSTATQLFGKRAAVTALALADTQEKTKDLEIALDDAGGTAQKVAEEQLNTLDGSIKLLTSAWQGFILSIEEGDGVIAKFVNGSLKTFADFLTELSNLDLILTRTSKLTLEQLSRTYDVLLTLNNKQGRNFRKFVDEYDDVSSTWLQNNKETAIDFLKELDFSNKDAERLYAEHLARLMDAELTAIDASLEASKKIKESSDKSTESQISNIDKIIPKVSELNEAWQKAIEVFGAETLDELFTDFEENQEEFYNKSLTLTKDYTDDKLKEAERERDELKRIEEEKQKIRQEFVNRAVSIGNTLFDLGQANRDKELESIQNNYQAQIAAAEGNSELQKKLADELAQKQKEINQQQAQSEKNQALFNIVIDTARAIAKANTVPPPGNIPAIAFATATGLAQAALVQSQPLPGFFMGTESAPAGMAWVAEKGRELITNSDGTSWIAEKPQIVDFKGGEKVVPNLETEKLLSSAIMNDIAVNGNKGIEDRLDGIAKTLKSQKIEEFHFNSKGFENYVRNNHSRLKKLNRIGRK